MLSAVLRHRLKALLLGAASVRLPVLGSSRTDLQAAANVMLQRAYARARLAGVSPEAALRSEFRDRMTGQLALVGVVVGATGAAVLLATEGAPELLTACVATLPSLTWLGALWAGERLER